MNKEHILTLIILVCNISIHSVKSDPTFENNEHVDIDVEQYTTELINNLLPKNYNKNLRPHYGGRPIFVNISLLINDISAISETEMHYKVDLDIRHYWNDHRLAFEVKHNVSRLTLGDEFVKRIWLPDSSFDNAKEVNAHKTFYSESTTLLRIKANGDILYSNRVTLVAQCPMDLTFFPLDQQKCSIEISSYGHLNSELMYHWTEDPPGVEINSKFYLPTFRLVGFDKFQTDAIFSTGAYSQLRCDIYLVRLIGFYLSQVYIPAVLIVIISWLPFWLDRHDHHARVALGVTTVLTMTTLTTSSSSDFPKISYLKAIDVYLFTCFVMVFLSLIEYAVVGYYEYVISSSGEMKANNKIVPTEQQQNQTQEPNQSSTKIVNLIKNTGAIDLWARWLFPGTFVAFNVIYIFSLSILVSINSKNDEIQVKL